jgi:hypothetical protein
MGPLEIVAIKFEGNRFTGEIMPELRNLVDRGVIRLIDLVFIRKEQGAEYSVTEVSEITDEEAISHRDVVEDVQGLLTPEDIEAVAETLPEMSSVAVLLFEHAWAAKLKDSVMRASGEVLMRERIPQEALDSLERELAGVQSTSGRR